MVQDLFWNDTGKEASVKQSIRLATKH
uniref:Uncharacterized protein n=1 Tax=Anopheles arabiensis TaxID=7173 RepID=A0A182IHU0_ANOAR